MSDLIADATGMRVVARNADNPYAPGPPRMNGETTVATSNAPGFTPVPVVVPEFVDPEPWVVGSYDGSSYRSAHPNWGMATNNERPRSAAEYEADQNR